MRQRYSDLEGSQVLGGGLAVLGAYDCVKDDFLALVQLAGTGAFDGNVSEQTGVRLQNRIGVNSGEVVTGGPIGGQAFVTGGPVILASRLETAAEVGTILLGTDTYRLVRDAVTTEEVAILISA